MVSAYKVSVRNREGLLDSMGWMKLAQDGVLLEAVVYIEFLALMKVI
jgi:hypothetical protein